MKYKEKNGYSSILNPIIDGVETIGFYFLLLFCFFTPIKFGLPYTFNIQQTVPLDVIEIFILSWPGEWAILMLFFSAFCYLLVAFNKKIEWNFSKCDLWLLLWSVFILIATFFKGTNVTGIQTVLLYFGYLLFFVLVRLYLNSPAKEERLWVAVFSSFIFCVLYGFYQHYEGLEETLRHAQEINLPELQNERFLTRLTGKKIFSFFIYSNSFAGYLIILIPLLWAFVISKKQRKVLLKSLSYGFCIFIPYLLYIGGKNYIHYLLHFITFPVSAIYMLKLTRSKGAIIALIISLLLIPFTIFSSKKSKVLYGILLIALTSVIYFTIQETFKKKVIDSAAVRKDYNYATIQMIRDYPLWGTGAGSYGAFYMQYKKNNAEEVQLAHNSFLQMAAEFGCGSLLLFSGFLAFLFSSFIHSTSRKTPYHYALSCSFIALCLHNIVDFDLSVPSLGYTSFLLLALLSRNRTTSNTMLSKHIKMTILSLSLVTFFVLVLLVSQIVNGQIAREKGLRNFSSGNFVSAIFFLEKAISYNPFSYSNHIHLAEVYQMSGNYTEAEGYFKKALALCENNAVTWLKYAFCMWNHDVKSGANRTKKILFAFQKAIDYYPTNSLMTEERNKYLCWIKKISQQGHA